MEGVHKIVWLMIVVNFVSLLYTIHFLLENFSTIKMSSTRLAVAILLPILIAVRGLKKKSLSKSGAIAGICVAFFAILCHWSFLASLMAFFLSGSKVTKYKAEIKRQIEGDAYKEGGQRNWIQVLCNGGVGLEICLLFIMKVGVAMDTPMDFSRFDSATYLGCAYLGAMACCNGDTWSSELGSVLSKSDPYLILTGKKVPRGTNGGVSLVGILASFLGGIVVGFAFWICIAYGSDTTALKMPAQYSVILLGGISGLIGSLIDSIMGCIFQFSGWDEDKKCVVEFKGPNVKHISGSPILDNHTVNLLSSLLTALVTPFIAIYIF